MYETNRASSGASSGTYHIPEEPLMERTLDAAQTALDNLLQRLDAVGLILTTCADSLTGAEPPQPAKTTTGLASTPPMGRAEVLRRAIDRAHDLVSEVERQTERLRTV